QSSHLVSVTNRARQGLMSRNVSDLLSYGGYHATLGGHTWASGQFTVPSVSRSDCNIGDDLAIWVGIGGGTSNSDRLVQAGVEMCRSSSTGAGVSHLFIEDFSADEPSCQGDTDLNHFWCPIDLSVFGVQSTVVANNVIQIYVSSNYDMPGKVF